MGEPNRFKNKTPGNSCETKIPGLLLDKGPIKNKQQTDGKIVQIWFKALGEILDQQLACAGPSGSTELPDCEIKSMCTSLAAHCCRPHMHVCSCCTRKRQSLDIRLLGSLFNNVNPKCSYFQRTRQEEPRHDDYVRGGYVHAVERGR